VTASQFARHLRLDYGLVKRLVRGLVAWQILERVPAGLAYRRQHGRWQPPFADRNR
jgi:hypothetical protein